MRLLSVRRHDGRVRVGRDKRQQDETTHPMDCPFGGNSARRGVFRFRSHQLAPFSPMPVSYAHRPAMPRVWFATRLAQPASRRDSPCCPLQLAVDALFAFRCHGTRGRDQSRAVAEALPPHKQPSRYLCHTRRDMPVVGGAQRAATVSCNPKTITI